MTLIPSFMTLAGLVCGLLGLYLRDPVLLAMSLAADILDGCLARWLDVVTEWGGELDWHVDVGLAAIALWTMAPYAVPLLVILQACMRVARKRVSGRAIVFLCLILVTARPTLLELCGRWC